MKLIRHMFKAYVEGPDKVIAPRWVEEVGKIDGVDWAYDEEQDCYHPVDPALILQNFDVDMDGGPKAA